MFRCLLLNSYDHAGGISLGFGCHHNPEVAINRAITEAAQARVVHISGARDDIVVNSIIKSSNLDVEEYKSNFIPQNHQAFKVDFQNAQQAIDAIIDKFNDLEFFEPLIYEFENTDPFSVVRVIGPSLAPSGARKGLPTSNHPRIHQFKPKLDAMQQEIVARQLFISS